MKPCIFSLFSLFGTGCGSYEPNFLYPSNHIEPELGALAENFADDMEAAGINLRGWPNAIRYVKQNGTLLGSCNIFAFGYSEVQIDPSAAGNKALVKALVYHEMTHCALYFNHDSEPDHIQSAELSSTRDWEQDWAAEFDYLLESIRSGDLPMIEPELESP